MTDAPQFKHPTLAVALAAFQAEVPKMTKDETAKVTGKNGQTGEKVSYKYGYAGLDQFVEIVEPVLGRHGLSVTSKTTFTDSLFMMEVSLLHESGERETAYWPLPDPRRVGPQDLGSAMTYGKRYLGWGLTGTFPGGMDDDGGQAQTAARERWEDAKPAQRPVEDRQAQAGQEPQAPPATQAPKTSWTDAEVADIQSKMPKVTLDKALGAYDWMAGKGLHDRKVGNPSVSATEVIAKRIAEVSFSSTVDEIAQLKTAATDRALLKVQVSETETLDQVLYEARELAVHAAVEQVKADTPSNP